MGGRSRTSLFYESFSLSSGLYFSGSDSSGEHPCDTSDSSSSSLSPTSGYSSYDLLDQDIPHDRTVRNTSRGWGENHTRSVSVPRIQPRTTQDYVTGIKPASHRIESHTSNCNVHSPTSTPNHSSTKYSGNDVQKQRRSSLTNQKEFFNLRISGLRREVWCKILVLFSFTVIIQYSSTNCFQDMGNNKDIESRRYDINHCLFSLFSLHGIYV